MQWWGSSNGTRTRSPQTIPISGCKTDRCLQEIKKLAEEHTVENLVIHIGTNDLKDDPHDVPNHEYIFFFHITEIQYQTVFTYKLYKWKCLFVLRKGSNKLHVASHIRNKRSRD